MKFKRNSFLESIIIFLLSVFITIYFLMLERLIGINWDFHPDAITYITLSNIMVHEIFPKSTFPLLNNAYYYVVAFLNQNIILAISLNIFIYSITNIIMFITYKKYIKTFKIGSLLNLFLFLLVLFNPYRLHLAVHILKDTFIILFFIIIVSQFRYSVLGWIPLLLFRLSSLLYSIPLIKKRNFIIFGVLFIIVAIMHPEVLDRIYNASEVDMRFRDFDKVPNFYEYGFVGSLLRAIIWPFFVFSGLFIILSPSIMYFPIALGSILTQLWIWISFKKFGYTFGIYISMGIFALLVTGFTSYIRYVFPLLIALPIILMNIEITKHKNLQRKI